ncbi:ESPR-type extended signal peptide-containing protein [uncultured Megasphaera sp.]|uniref:ESPR-type extended signal peptide-containing protein n=1 Tax=uncultured Megasphaera sp. TaxID=165188 RepID=UPI00261FA877|nr:ESPR-type extended signal peptide-containing protein [uncultured Megasphaera sp.]
MNKIYKVIYSKAKHSFVVVSELAHSHTKPAAMAGTTRRGLSALVLTALLMSVSPAAFAATENVVYDSDGKTITLENTDGNGTKIHNVADGFLGAGSQDAVNGRQLYSTNLRITDIADALTKNNSIIAQAQTDITRVKTQNITFKSDINTLKTQVTTGWNATIDGAKVKTVNPSSNSLNFSAGDDISLVDPGNGSIKVSVAPTGAVADGNTHAVSGGTVYTAIKAEQTARTQADTDLSNKIGSLDNNGNYIQKDASVSSNLSTLDTQVKSNADAIDKEKTDREAAITNVTNNIGDLSNSAVKYDADSNKGKVTLAGEGGTTITNVKDGALSDSSTDAVTGKQLYAEQQARTQAVTDLTNKVGSLDANGNYIQKDASVSSNLSTLDTQVKSNADAIDKEKTDREAAITNITNNIGDLSNSAVKYDTDTNKTKVTLAGNGGTTLTNVKAGALSDSSLDAVNGSQLYAEQQARIQAVTDINNTIGTLRGNAVLYDTDAKDLVTFGGSKGTRLTNLKDAALTATSTDAVTGRQLYTTNQNISGFADQIAKNAGKLESLATSVTNSLDSVSAMSESVTAIDSTKADASLNNLSADGLQVITNAANNAVQAYMKNLKSQSGTTGTQTGSSSSAPAKAAGTQTVSLASLSKMAVSPNSPFVSLAATGTPENVVYDSDGKTITLENTDGNGTKIQNVADGFLGAGSQDAVNGRQLYATNLRITDIADALSKNNSTIAQAQTDITRVKTQNITFKSDINTLKTQVGTGWNATINGAKLKTVNPSNNILNFTNGDDIALTDAGNGSLKVAVKASGKVEAGDAHVVTGDAVYQAIKNMPTTGSLSGKANTALDNINDAGKTVIRDLAKDVLTDSLATKANTDASNIDTDAYTKKLGTGTNAQGSTGLVTGDTLYNAVKDKADKSYVDEGLSKKADKDSVYTKDETYNRAEIDDKVQKVSQDLSGKADTDLGNLTDAGKTVITDLAKGSVKVVAGKNTTVTEGTKDGAKTYAVNVEDSAIQKAVQPKLDQKANVDASNLTADNVASWQKALGTGSIDKDSTGLVTGQVVYQAIKDMPTGEGLVKYDEGTKTITVAADKDATKVDFSGKDSDGHTINRTITGIVTDAKDATSAANVGYVQDVAGSLANGVQRVANQLSHDINKVGAGAAALAGLHPGEFDPDNKLDFAAGYGHYKGANAGALGAYYHPNEDTIISLAGTMGNGDPMLSAGVTFKLGPSGPNTLSRTALTKQVAKDQQTIKALAGELANVKNQLNRVLSLLDMSKKAPFSDVPADHWAKDAVDTLHGNGAIKGYPDGKFHGDKPMTRYEYAEMLYEALQKGAHVDQATLDEYAPELSQVKANNQK